jgi:hypothetical protein
MEIWTFWTNLENLDSLDKLDKLDNLNSLDILDSKSDEEWFFMGDLETEKVTWTDECCICSDTRAMKLCETCQAHVCLLHFVKSKCALCSLQ